MYILLRFSHNWWVELLLEQLKGYSYYSQLYVGHRGWNIKKNIVMTHTSKLKCLVIF